MVTAVTCNRILGKFAQITPSYHRQIKHAAPGAPGAPKFEVLLGNQQAPLGNLEALYVESKAWTVSVKPSDGYMLAPEKELHAKKNMLHFLHFLHFLHPAPRRLGVKSAESAPCFCNLY